MIPMFTPFPVFCDLCGDLFYSSVVQPAPYVGDSLLNRVCRPCYQYPLIRVGVA
jgi:hypothetical protein